MIDIRNLALIHFRFLKSRFRQETTEIFPVRSKIRLNVVVARIYILIFDFAPVEKKPISLKLNQLRSRTVLKPTPEFRELGKLYTNANVSPLSFPELFDDRS